MFTIYIFFAGLCAVSEAKFPLGGDLSTLLLAKNAKPVKLFNPQPRGVDWRTRGAWLTTVQDQNPCNNCWAFAATALVETMVHIEHGVWSKRSEGDLRDGWGGRLGEDWRKRDKVLPCAHGAGVTGALDWIKNNGLADPDCFAWSPKDREYAPTSDRVGRTTRIPAYTDIGSTSEQKKWLDAVGPIIASFQVFDDFFSVNSSRVYKQSKSAKYSGDHVVLVVGYDDIRECWIIRNSYGTGWGDKGYACIGYGECKIDVYSKQGLRGTNPDPWTRRRLHNGCMIESGNGAAHRNFELLRAGASSIQQVWRQGGENQDFSWHSASVFAVGTHPMGMPAFTSTTYNRNFEAVYWDKAGYLRHWFLDQGNKVWNDGGSFGAGLVDGFPGFIQSNYDAPGNLEVIVRSPDGRLQLFSRSGPPSFTWKNGGKFASGVLMSGPSLVQANVGTRGNFYVVAVLNTGQLQMWWRNNDVAGMPWNKGETFGSGIPKTPACMIQGQYGANDEKAPGNFELCVAVGGQVQHWWSPVSGSWKRAATFGSNIKHVWGLLEGSFGFNLEVIVELQDGRLAHWFINDGKWNDGGAINALPGCPSTCHIIQIIPPTSKSCKLPNPPLGCDRAETIANNKECNKDRARCSKGLYI